VLKKTFIVPFILLCIVSCRNSQDSTQLSNREAKSPDEIKIVMSDVAHWQLENWEKNQEELLTWSDQLGTKNWVFASLYPGLIAANDILNDQLVQDRLEITAYENQWLLGDETYFADDHLVAHLYLKLYQQSPEAYKIEHIKSTFDTIISNPQTSSLYFPTQQEVDDGTPRCIFRWCWSDALFMSPPNWFYLSQITQDPKYAQFADKEFWLTKDYLYDEEQGLFFRDSTYFTKKELNGEKVFWSRGNAWVFAGIVEILKHIDPDHPSKQAYQTLFISMSERLINLQQSSGFWSSSLLAPDLYPQPESSGTGFFVYGLAWGINQKLLDSERFLPSTVQGWNALVTTVNQQGKVGWVQPLASEPSDTTYQTTQLYGAGAFLLAASEVFLLLAD